MGANKAELSSHSPSMSPRSASWSAQLGQILAEQPAPLRPDVKVRYLSGYTDDAVVRHGILQEGVRFQQESFIPTVLLKKVRDALDN